jgi:hypothetical protein
MVSFDFDPERTPRDARRIEWRYPGCADCWTVCTRVSDTNRESGRLDPFFALALPS